MSWLDELDRELARVGIRGARRRRILDEVADHVACEPGSEARLGEPAVVAQRFADELAPRVGVRATLVSFGALAAAGAVFAATWLLVPSAGGPPDVFAGEPAALGLLAAAALVVCPQVALAAGLLAVLRALRLRGRSDVPSAEVALLLRRAATAVAFGSAALVALAAYAVAFRSELESWWVLAAGLGAAAVLVALVCAAVTILRAGALRSSVPGGAGGVFDDLPVSLSRRPWLLCLAVAAAAALAALAAGGADEGPQNAAAEAMLVVACFAALGRRLGLRH